MAYIEEANELMTDATGQSIATAIGNMSATSVGNLAALQTTDKTSLVGAVNEVKSGLTSLSTLNSGTLSGVRYIQAGELVLVSIARQALSDGDSLGAPASINTIIAVLRDDTSGGCVQVAINTSLQINKGAGQVNFTDGHNYSGYFAYIAS